MSRGSKARAKGTKGENEVVDILVEAGFPRADPEDPTSDGVKRFEGGYESHDIQGVGNWVIEVKYRKAWQLFSWIRKIRKKSWVDVSEEWQISSSSEGFWQDGYERPWAIFAIHGDRRSSEGKAVGRVCVMDADMAARLIHHYESVTNPVSGL